MASSAEVRPSEAPVDLNRDLFVRQLLRELSGTLQDVVGVEDAAGYISVVGRAMGEQIDKEYKRALAVNQLSREQVAEVLVDLKKRIEGKFFIIEETEEKIVFGNTACPFGEMVKGRPSLCMMTSNVFGYVAAQNLGYAAVELDETIAEGHRGCRVTVYLRPPENLQASSREYFRHDEPGSTR